MTDTNEKQGRRPDFNIHTKVADGAETRIGPRIGVAFRHKDGEGLNILLDAMPIPLNGQVELVGFPVKD
ncbi:MAG: hypothetical protein GC192_21245 [Bacteroidetes bacterium]|nr:hypothetical protein [Bacteroidota bacterium]